MKSLKMIIRNRRSQGGSVEDPGRRTVKHIFMEFADLVARMKIQKLRKRPLRLMFITCLNPAITKPRT